MARVSQVVAEAYVAYHDALFNMLETALRKIVVDFSSDYIEKLLSQNNFLHFNKYEINLRKEDNNFVKGLLYFAQP